MTDKKTAHKSIHKQHDQQVRKLRKRWHKRHHKKNAISVVAILFGIVILYGIFASVNDAGFGSEKVIFDVYVMSQCPYGTQVEDAFIPVLKELGDSVQLNLDYIVTDLGGGNFRSLHGEPETKGNIVQLCAKEHNPEEYLDFILCVNQDARSIPGNWESCAEQTSLDIEKVRTCYEGDEGKQLLSESAARAAAAGAQGSPTMFVNGQPYQSARDPLSFKRALCANLEGHSACEGIPACGSDAECTAQPEKIGKCENPNTEEAKCVYVDPVKVDVTILNDEDCKACDVTNVVSVIQQLFKGAEIKYVPLSTDEGKQFAEELGLIYAPAYVFSKDVTETEAWSLNAQLRAAFLEVGEYYRLRDEATGASYFIDEEAKAAHFAELGVELGNNRPQVDFFVMSYCPYGNQAEELLGPVFEMFSEDADFNPRYVLYSNYQGGGPAYCFDDDSKYCSMHGIQELNQNLREICVNKHMGTEKWFEFAFAMNDNCNYQNADTCWQAVADDLGLDKEVITDCFDNEGMEILAEELRLNQVYGVSGSPTLFFDGERYAGERSSNGYAAALCSAFDTAPSECEGVQIESPVQPTPQGDYAACG